MKNDFLLLLQKICEVQRFLLWEKTKECGLSPMQIQILIFVYNCRQKNSTVSRISTNFNLKPPTVSESIKTLRRKNLVEQSECQTDRRVHCYQLTAKGRELINQINSWAAPLGDIFDELEKKDKTCLVKNIYKVVYSLNKSSLICGLSFCPDCIHFKQGKVSGCSYLKIKFVQDVFRLNCPHFEKEDDVSITN